MSNINGRKIPKDKEIIFPNIGTKRQRKLHYCDQVVKHPAKMPTYLADWIIETFTKPGDTILDAMCGIGTTCIQASLLGRHAIGIDYEQKFIDLCEQSKEKSLEYLSVPLSRGEMIFLQGDSKDISRLFVENVDRIVISPPYGQRNEALKYQKVDQENKSQMYRNYNDDDPDLKDPTQIGNFQIGSIIISPPYSHQSYKAKGDKPTKWREDHKKDWGEIGHEKSAEPYVDDVVMSPPYGHKGSTYKMKPEIVENNPNMKGRKAYTDEGAEDYSQFNDNIGMLTGKTYETEMQKIYNSCYEVLKPMGKMILVIKNYVRKKKEQRLDLLTIKLCEEAGFTLVDTWYAKLNTKSFWQILQSKRCSYTKFVKRDKVKEPLNGHMYVPSRIGYDFVDISDWEGRQFAMCGWLDHYYHCPYKKEATGADQTKCDFYKNTYPQIDHEYVLVFKK